MPKAFGGNGMEMCKVGFGFLCFRKSRLWRIGLNANWYFLALSVTNKILAMPAGNFTTFDDFMRRLEASCSDFCYLCLPKISRVIASNSREHEKNMNSESGAKMCSTTFVTGEHQNLTANFWWNCCNNTLLCINNRWLHSIHPINF